MTRVECVVSSCSFRGAPIDSKYGICTLPSIKLRFRAALDMGKGTYVLVDCLQMELPQDKQQTPPAPVGVSDGCAEGEHL